MRSEGSAVAAPWAAVILALALGCATVPSVGGHSGDDPKGVEDEKPNQKEFALLAVGRDAEQKCVLMEQTPGEIRTTFSGMAEWIVVGNCNPDDRVQISPEFRLGDGRHRLIASGNRPTPATNGRKLRIKLKNKGQIQPGVYRYTVLINGQPARYNPPANSGTFEVCPEWPCRAAR